MSDTTQKPSPFLWRVGRLPFMTEAAALRHSAIEGGRPEPYVLVPCERRDS